MNKVYVTYKEYSEEFLQAHPDIVFVFGDNLMQVGRGGQAIIRYEANAFGIPTKKKPSNYDDSFFNDDDFDTAKAAIDSAIENLLQLIENKALAGVCFPSGGLGTGLAKLSERAPKVFVYLCDVLLKRFGFNNAKLEDNNGLNILEDSSSSNNN